MRQAIWLAWKEISRRPSGLLSSLLAIALLVALVTSLEILARSREEALSAEIDRAGPSLWIVPEGVGAGELSRLQMGDAMLPESLTAAVGHALADASRVIERRLTRKDALEGEPVVVIGVEPRDSLVAEASGWSPTSGQVALGSLIAGRLGRRAGDGIHYRERTLRVASVLPERGTPIDMALVLSLTDLQSILGVSGKINELRITLAAGTSSKAMRTVLQARFPDASVIRMDRGPVAEGQLTAILRQHGRALYPIIVPSCALALALMVLLNVREREEELAVLEAMGMGKGERLVLLATRSVFVGVLGGLTGSLLGLLTVGFLGAPAAYGQDVSSLLELIAACIVGSVVLSLVVSSCPIVFGAWQLPLKGLQD